MELVEGETLAARLKRGPLPAEEALSISKQIVEALEAAHEKGIVHRDLKPGNVMVLPDGKVKVLDFGLARAMSGANASPAGRSHQGMDANPASNLTNSPTLSMAATQAGVILGTAAYMSPEQAKGLSADSRSDVFSFGCVLYEMLSGRQAFSGETSSEVLASVLVRDPEAVAAEPESKALRSAPRLPRENSETTVAGRRRSTRRVGSRCRRSLLDNGSAGGDRSPLTKTGKARLEFARPGDDRHHNPRNVAVP